MKTLSYTIKQAFIQFGRNRSMSIISIFAITCMLLILSLFFILFINVNSAAETIKGDYDSIEIFLLDETTQDQANVMIDDMKQQDGVADAFYKSKDEAMAEFKARWGDNGYLLDSLKDNPLPNSVVIKIDDLEKADALAEHAATYEGIEDVKYYNHCIKYDQAHGVQQGRGNQHNEICRSHELVHQRPVPRGGHTDRSNIGSDSVDYHISGIQSAG